jgi:hypothetical protein
MAEHYPERHEERMEPLAKKTLAKRDHLLAELNPTFFTFVVISSSKSLAALPSRDSSPANRLKNCYPYEFRTSLRFKHL